MKGSSHLLMAGCAGTALSVAINGTLDPVFVVITAVGGLAPDLDHPGSKLGRKLLPLSIPIWLLFGHRGGTHSLIATTAFLMLAAGLSWFNPVIGWWAAGFGIGYGVHLICDSMTRSGIPLWWPLSQERVGLRWFATGSLMEYLVLLTTVSATGALLTLS